MRWVWLLLLCVPVCGAGEVLEAKFDGTLDAVGATGTLVGDAALVPEGVRGGALKIAAAGGSRFKLGQPLPLNQGALQFWIKPSFGTRDGQRHWLICDSQSRFKIFKYTDSNTYFQIRTDTGGVHARAVVDWVPDKWMNLAVTWENLNSGADNGLLQIYVNGTPKATLRGNFSLKSFGDTLFVGCDPQGQESAAGLLDELQISAEPRVRVEFPEGLAPAHDPADYALTARGARVTASSELLAFKGKDYPASAMIDGDVKGAYWASDFIRGGAKGDQWLEVELAKPALVGRISVYMVSTNPGMLTDRLSLSVWSGEQWRKVGEVADYRKSVQGDQIINRYTQAYGVYTARFEPVTTTKVRLDIPGTTVRLHEIEVLPPLPAAAAMPVSLQGAGPIYRFGDSSGCGWRNLDNLIGVNRASGYPATSDFLAAACSDNGLVSNTFGLKLPNGRYAVGVVSGDADFDMLPFRIVANGRELASRVATADRGECRLTRGLVDVTNGRLDLTFSGEHTWIANAVVVGPAAQLQQVDAALTELGDTFAIGSPELLAGLREIKPEPPAQAATATAADGRRGYQLFTRGGGLGTIYRTDLPADGEPVTALSLAATPGEYEPVTFALHALQPLSGVRVRVGDLRGPGAIPAAAWDVRAVEYLPQRFKMSVRDGWAPMPEILRPQDHWGEMWLSPGHNQQYWLTVKVPEQTPPGDYTGQVTISSSAGESTLPLSLRVYPFTLATPTGQNLGIYYYAQLSGAANVQSAANPDRLVLADLRDMREHGLNFFVLNLPGEAINWSASPVTFDLSHLRWIMGLARQVGGFDGIFPVYMGGAWKADRPDAAQVVQNLIRAIEVERKAQGWPEFLYYLVDEPFGGEKLEQAVAPYQAAKGVPGIRTYSTVSGQAAEKLAPWLDVRCHATSGSTGYFWPGVYEKAMADKDDYWWYSNCTREFPAVMRFKAGFHHLKSRATGQTYWHYRNLIGSAYCDFDGTSFDYITSYPGVDGPVPTLQWECHREGLDDFKYAALLQALIARAEKSVRPEARAAAAAAAAVLKGIMDSAVIDLHYYQEKYGSDLAFHYVSDWPGEKYDQARRALAEQIVKLQPLAR